VGEISSVSGTPCPCPSFINRGGHIDQSGAPRFYQGDDVVPLGCVGKQDSLSASTLEEEAMASSPLLQDTESP
jgi:hypothetical protein